ncbi:MAG: rhomboid family intramembrane serine protease [Bernardetiaceae bacterium]|jgi:membrane associated rhomboid family serine protease|nr:rhomboid family intramembrane serine protease [Bernardetiaceae bacterium]
MNTFTRDIKAEWYKQNNAVMRFIIINIAVFVVIHLIRFGLYIAGHADWFAHVQDTLSVNPNLGTFIVRPWTLLSYGFVHLDPLHILFNMLFLYWFGRIINEFLGGQKLVALYVYGTLAGGLLFLLLYNTVPYFANLRGPEMSMIGASAAIYAIMVGAATLMPDYTVFLFLFGPVRLKWLVAISVFLSFISTIGINGGGNVAHIGGAIFGFVFIRQLQAGNDWSRPMIRFADWVGTLFSRKPRPKRYKDDRRGTANSGGNRAGQSANPSQEEVDRILDKISAHGYESLSQEEKQMLFRASQKK